MKRVKAIIRYDCDGIINRKWLGKGIVVVVLDTGVAPHPELAGRFLIFKDFVNGQKEMYDDNGHGTHVSGILAGKQVGIAPECSLIMLKVLDEKGEGDAEYTMKGIRWILEHQEQYNIRIVNISMGMRKGKNEQTAKCILKGVELLWDMGMVVVASAGNQGPQKGSITIPGIQKKIITVGAMDMKNSGRGSLELDMLKPDLVVPGAGILSCNANWNEGEYLIKKSGTSMAAPVVSGAAACLLSKDFNLPNEEIKKYLKKNCNNLGRESTWQGSGVLNMEKLLK